MKTQRLTTGSAALVPEEPAIAALGSYGQLIAQCISDGWSEAHRRLHDMRGMGKTALATTANDAIANELQVAFDGIKGSTWIELSNRLRFLYVAGAQPLAIRVKKLTGGLLASNIRTQQQDEWDNQQALEGVPDSWRLTFGYRLNSAETKIEELWITHQVGDLVIWSHAVDVPATTAEKVATKRGKKETTRASIGGLPLKGRGGRARKAKAGKAD
jgi:hypothetical protein